MRGSHGSRACHSPAPAHEKEASHFERLGREKVIRLVSILSDLVNTPLLSVRNNCYGWQACASWSDLRRMGILWLVFLL